jgi:transposase
MGKPKRTAEEVKEALYATGGIVTQAAARLGVSDTTVWNYLADTYAEELAGVREEAERLLIEESKQCVREAVKDGDWRAAQYVLKSRAGWTEKQQVDVTSDGNSIERTVLILPDNGRGPDGDD